MKRTNLLFCVATTLGLLATNAHAAPGQMLALDVQGPQVNGGKVRRCQDVAYRHGFTLAQNAPVHVALGLMSGYNHLTVTSARRGVLVDAPKPAWGMEQLCEDAMMEAERAYAEEGRPARPSAPPPQYAPAPPTYAPQGGQPTIFLDVVGPAANPGKVARCMGVAQRRGVVLSPSASMRVTLELANGFNRLRIQSRRGEIYNQPKPGWGMEQLCEDAIQQVMMVWDGGGAPQAYQPPPQYNQAPPQPAYQPPPSSPPPRAPGYALGPIPPSKELAPNVKALADSAVHNWQAANFEGALKDFREAHAASGDPQFLFDQAVCEQRLNHSREALAHTQQFLDKAPTSPYRPYADQLFGELQAASGNE